ncbi:MAG: hypothetical protein KKG93_14300 [Bacteroidetes bacterium]|nr:hypothetical protein [Bacteroidota bacterium]
MPMILDSIVSAYTNYHSSKRKVGIVKDYSTRIIDAQLRAAGFTKRIDIDILTEQLLSKLFSYSGNSSNPYIIEKYNSSPKPIFEETEAFFLLFTLIKDEIKVEKLTSK